MRTMVDLLDYRGFEQETCVFLEVAAQLPAASMQKVRLGGQGDD